MKKPSSKKPGKQRKWKVKAPLHKRKKMMSSHLNPELKKKYERRAVPVRKGDVVKVMTGSSNGASGEVVRVDRKKYKIYVEGVTGKKADGTDVEKSIDPSNVMITELFIEDKERREMLERTITEKKIK